MVRLKEYRRNILVGQLNEFQFLMVRLKDHISLRYRINIYISIPYGAIKSRFFVKAA